MVVIVQRQTVHRRIYTQTLRNCNCRVRFVVMLSISNNLLVDFFAYVVAVFLCSSGHPVDVDLEFLLRNFKSFLLLLVVVL